MVVATAMTLPTYKEAVDGPNIFALITPFIDDNELSVCCRVSRGFSKTFLPAVWADPIEILARKVLPYTSTYNFIIKAPKVRLETRALVLTLDFRPLLVPPACRSHELDYQNYENIITGPWLCRLIPWLPNLRFVVLDALGGFDTENLGIEFESQNEQPFGTTNYDRDAEGSSTESQVLDREQVGRKIYIQLILLSALRSHTLNSALVITSPAMQGLMYLDISGTLRPETWTRVFASTQLPNLRVLKMRGLRLTDRLLPQAVTGTGCKLWSLDLRNNLLTDTTVDNLLLSCFRPRLPPPEQAIVTSSDEHYYEDVPIYNRHRSNNDQLIDVVPPLRPDQADTFMQYLIAFGHLSSTSGPPVDYESDNIVKPTGLTNLYIAGNKFTSWGIRRLLKGTNRLQVLDVGSVRTPPVEQFQIPHTTTWAQPDSTGSLHHETQTRLEDLRIHHSIVTYVPTIVNAETSIDAPPATFSQSLLYHAEIEQAARQMKLWKSFTPSANHRLQKLTLTGIPTKSLGPVIDRLTEFIDLCASQEEHIKSAREGIGSSHHRSPQLLPGLRILRLEFAAEEDFAQSPTSWSVSGDRDADEFMAQSDADFSFFDQSFTSNSRRESITSSLGTARISPRIAVLNYRDVANELKIYRQKGPKWGGKLELVYPT